MHDLAVVMPVYNEEACIQEVVRSWHQTISQLNIDFIIIVLNDGSRDTTAQKLEIFKDHPQIKIINKANSGHGPTILLGYHQAVEQAAWVFQCDSDDEMKPDSFVRLWEHRQDHDALFGQRHGRQQNWLRKIISMGSRCTVFAFCGKGVSDVNVPYRLIRSGILKVIVDQIPPDTFAPNVIISAGLNRLKARVWECPVDHEPRRTGKSLASLKAFKAAFKAFNQTSQCLLKMKLEVK